ncbi:CPXCG motif-containing cysteine-rich protein [Oceanobacter antarcticus]
MSPMHLLQEKRIGCPYCGELIGILIDLSEPEQEYVEDCSVCCQPMRLVVTVPADGEADVQVLTADDSF